MRNLFVSISVLLLALLLAGCSRDAVKAPAQTTDATDSDITTVETTETFAPDTETKEITEADAVTETSAPWTEKDTDATIPPETEPQRTPETDVLGVRGNDGRVTYVDIKDKMSTAKYSIRYPELADDDIKRAVNRLRELSGLKTKIDYGGEYSSELYDVVPMIEEPFVQNFNSEDYEIYAEGNTIYLLGGSVDSLFEAIEVFSDNFIDKKEKKVLIPGETYAANNRFYVGNVKVNGIDLSKFLICADPDDYSIEVPSDVVSVDIAKELSEGLNLPDGKKLALDDRIRRNKNYIVISARSSNINGYSVEIKDGNIYVSGSPISAEKAVDVLLYDVLGAKKLSSKVDNSTVLELTSKNNVSGKLTHAAPYSKEELISAFVEAGKSDGMIISGAHAFNWTRSSNGIAVSQTLERFENAFGETVAIMEFDVGKYSTIAESAAKKELFSEYDLARLVSEAVLHVEKGGIIFVSSHVMNPNHSATNNTGFRGSIGTNSAFEQLYKEGSTLNKNMLKSFDGTFEVLKAFSDNGIPVIYRPLHEMTGNWFWWCIYQNGGEKIYATNWANLWRYIHDYVEDKLGCANIVWSYSTANAETLYPYPGDEYADIVGIDWYTSGNREINQNSTYEKLMTAGKPTGLTEFGGPAPSTGYSCESFLGDMKWMISKDLDLAFFTVWTTNGSFNGMGKGDILFGDPIIYTRSDMLEYWKNH